MKEDCGSFMSGSYSFQRLLRATGGLKAGRGECCLVGPWWPPGAVGTRQVSSGHYCSPPREDSGVGLPSASLPSGDEAHQLGTTGL